MAGDTILQPRYRFRINICTYIPQTMIAFRLGTAALLTRGRSSHKNTRPLADVIIRAGVIYERILNIIFADDPGIMKDCQREVDE